MQAHRYTTDYAGFSLVEVLVALAVVSIITTAVVFAFNFGRPRAETLILYSNKVHNAIQRYEIDTGCVPLSLDVLTSKVDASNTWSNSCHANVSAKWNGPYLENTSFIRAALGPGGWVGMYVGLGPRLWLALTFYTQKSIALQTKHLSQNRFRTFGCGGSGPMCYVAIVYQ